MIFSMITKALIALMLAASTFAGAAERAHPVAVGDVAPDFTLTDQNGRKQSLATERGKRPVVLVFYRGYW